MILATFSSAGALTLDYKSFRFIEARKPVLQVWRSNNTYYQATVTFDSATKIYTWTFPWGTFTAQCVVGDRRLTYSFQLHNNSAQDIIGIFFQLPFINFPTAHVGDFNFDPSPVTSQSSIRPPISTHMWDQGRMAWCCESKDEVMIRLPPGTTSTIRHASCATRAVGDAETTPFTTPVLAGQSSPVYTCSLRFDESVDDIYANFRAAYPYRQLLCDNRAIERWLGIDKSFRTETNPNGWTFIDYRQINTITPEGLAAFRIAVLNEAHARLARMQQVGKLGAQGLIMWQVEGNRSASFTYVGDPRVTYVNAPEWTYETNGVKLLHEFFNIFKRVGMRIGVTLRKGKITVDPVTFAMSVDRNVDEVEDYIDKIAYAKAEWGCTLFYIDSIDARYSGPVLEKVFEAHPDVLLLPERSSIRAAAVSSGHRNGVKTGSALTKTLQETRNVYPDAFLFAAVNSSQVPIDLNSDPAVLAEYVAAVKDGDGMLMTSNRDGTASLTAAQIVYGAAGY